MQDMSGQSIKGYDLLERIGVTGFGAVYRAFQSTVGREVAIKIILPGYANQPDFIRRFRTEARLVAWLEHPYIVPFIDFWRDPDGAYLVMRLLRGGSLKEAIRQRAFSFDRVVRVLDQVTSALELAHRNNIIHRDIKPANILLDEDGNAYLGDFGITTVIHALNENLAKPDAFIDSLDYISPEQARGEGVTTRADIYSLGVVLYEMLAGQHPFHASSSVDKMYKHLNELLPELADTDGRTTAINNVIQQATAKKPADRFDTVLALATAFREAAGLHLPKPAESVIEQLTLREHEVLKGIVDGQSNNEIAENLVLTVGTVKWYTNQIYKKLGVRSRVQAMVRARELDLLVDSSVYPAVAVDKTIRVALPEPENPYKGLRPFQAADYTHFFGRESLVKKLLDHLGAKDSNGSTNRFLAVVGPSGSGKSSVVQAGLIPALWHGDLPGSEKWFAVEITPGAQPLEELEIGLMRIAAHQSGSLMDLLQRDMRGLLRVAKLILPDDDSELLVVVDQFEELFTLVEDEDQRSHFLDLLYTAVTDSRSRVRVVITLRADFYDRPLYYQEFGQLVRENLVTLMPLSAEELESAIIRPASDQALTFETGLVATIIDDVSYQPGALPLLQYALTELFDRRDGRELTRQAYQAIGGTVGALARRAEEIYAEQDQVGQAEVRQMFLRLVTLGEGVEDTRRRVDRKELIAIASDPEVMDEMIDVYAAYRMLSLDHDPTNRRPTVEVAHEALLREWERLRGWLNKSREDIRSQRLLITAARHWRNANRDARYGIDPG
ncbi:protein kinase [Chloroflexota bacterium]